MASYIYQVVATSSYNYHFIFPYGQVAYQLITRPQLADSLDVSNGA